MKVSAGITIDLTREEAGYLIAYLSQNYYPMMCEVSCEGMEQHGRESLARLYDNLVAAVSVDVAGDPVLDCDRNASSNHGYSILFA